MEPEMQQMEDAGRGTDSSAVGGTMAHLSLGEVVIPRAFLDDPQVMEMLQVLFEQNGSNLAEFTVGDPANKINPETGYPEFGFFKSLKKIFKIAAPAALAYFAPGLGTALGGSILGAGAAGASTLGSALVGGGLGALTGGGLKGALTGAALGGVGANLGNVGSAANPGSGILGAAGKNIPGIYDIAQGASDIGNGVSGLFGTSQDSVTLPGIGKTGLGNGTGLRGLGDSLSNSLAGGNAAGGSSLATAATGGGSTFSPISIAANAFGGYNQDEAIKKQREQLLLANQKQQANLESFDPSGITSDPGYQFNLEQGQKGLNQGLAAGGQLFSGKALKAATKYNQDYANNAFNDYYQRWASKVGSQNALYGAAGDVNANATGAGAQNISQSLSNALGARVGQYGGNALGGLTPAQLKALGLVA